MSNTPEVARVPSPRSSALRTMVRTIFFRASQIELEQLSRRHLLLGLGCTWLVGVGRYWDNPKVGLLQHLGLGSVIYVFVLALFLWLIIWPLRPRHWSYFRVLTFLTLVSPPAILYAIPVQMFFDYLTANYINVSFLAVVATWRVALLVFFLRRLGELNWSSIVVGTLLPLTLIVVALSSLNLDRAVFSIMGGMQQLTPNDGVFLVLQGLSLLSVFLFVPLLLSYLIIIATRFSSVKESKPTLSRNDHEQ